MREFSQTDLKRINNYTTYADILKEFNKGTMGYACAEYIIKIEEDSSCFLDVDFTNEAILIIYSNGAKSSEVVISKESFSRVKNFKNIYKELLKLSSNDNDKVYKVLLELFVINKIRVFIQKEFESNLAVPKIFIPGIPSILESVHYIDKIIDLIENANEAFVVFINNQDLAHENIVVNRLKNVITENNILAEKIQTLDKELLQEKQAFLAEAKKSKNSIITIASLIVSIVPLLTININMLANSFNLIMLFCANGILLNVIGITYYFVERISNNTKASDNKPFIVFICIGCALLVLGVGLYIISLFYPTFIK